MGQVIGDLNLRGGLQKGGRIATRGSILGNLTINGKVATGSKIISGGSIGSAALGTGFSFGVNQGIVGTGGSIINVLNSKTVAPGFYSQDNDGVPPPLNFNTQAIDAIFSDPTTNTFLLGFDILANGDLEGLTDILRELVRLHVYKDHLSVNPNGK